MSTYPIYVRIISWKLVDKLSIPCLNYMNFYYYDFSPPASLLPQEKATFLYFSLAKTTVKHGAC